MTSLLFCNIQMLHVKLFLSVFPTKCSMFLLNLKAEQQEQSLLFFVLFMFILLTNLSVYIYNGKYIYFLKKM